MTWRRSERTSTKRFQASLTAQINSELTLARQGAQSGNLIPAMNACDRAGLLLGHLSKSNQPRLREEAEALVTELLQKGGIVVVVPQGRFVYGSSSYMSELLPLLDQALESRGFLPPRESSPFRDLWRHAIFQIRLAVQEIQEGTYLSSQNRLTLIHAELALTSGKRQLWQSTPRARSAEPLPNLPANLARSIAVSPKRLEEFEKLLYENARDQIVQRFRTALANMPSRDSLAPSK